MQKRWIVRAALFVFVIALVAALAWLTASPATDPCANGQPDISAAVLAESTGDQDALLDRAIILRGKCKKPTPPRQP